MYIIQALLYFNIKITYFLYEIKIIKKIITIILCFLSVKEVCEMFLVFGLTSCFSFIKKSELCKNLKNGITKHIKYISLLLLYFIIKITCLFIFTKTTAKKIPFVT